VPELYAQTFDLIPKPGLSGAEAFLSILKEWVKDKWPSDFPWLNLSEAESLKLADGTIFRWEPYYASTPEILLEFTFRHPDIRFPEVQWSTQCSLFSKGNRFRLTLRVNNTGPEIGEPGVLLTSRPRLVLLLHQAFDFANNEFAQRDYFSQVSANEAEDFVQYVLFDKDRKYPVLVSSPRIDGSYPITGEKLAKDFCSLANVVVLSSPETAANFTRAIGSRFLSCINGGLRIYLPGFAKDSEPLDHPLLIGSRASNPSERARFSNYLSLATTRSFQIDYRLNHLRDERTLAYDNRRRALNEELEKAKSGSLETNTWEDLAESYARDNKSLLERLLKLEEELADAERTIASLQYSLNAKQLGHTHESEKSLSFESAYEAVEMAKELFSDDILILDTALASAKDTPYSRPDIVWKSLQAIQTISSQRKKSPLGKNIKSAFSELGQDYRVGLSESSSKKIKNQYRFSENGKEYFCEEHLCHGVTADPATCLRIYFTTTLETEDRIVIGHVGRHLDVSSTN